MQLRWLYCRRVERLSLGGEHLPAGDAVFVEEVVVAVQQFHLPDGREELAGRNGVDAASDAGFEQAAA